MTDTVMTTATEPDGAPRLASLDILRGIAILAILFMNIPAMGGALWVIFEDHGRYGWTVADRIAWGVQHVVAEGTARCMLEMLFGVGMVILTDRAAKTAQGRWTVLRQYAWRNIVLFVFGLVHVFILLWPGDILHTYGLAALLAVLFRRLGPKWLLGIGLSLALFSLVGGGIGTVVARNTTTEAARLEAKRAGGATLTGDERKTLADAAKAKAERDREQAEMRQRIVDEDVARAPATGTFLSWATAQWRDFLTLQAWGLEILFIWEALATMLIGAALYKWGVIQGGRSSAFYARLLVLGYAGGFALRGFSAYETLALPGQPGVSGFTYDTARILVTLGHIALVHLLLDSAAGRRLLRPFEAAGRTALSIYIAQTLITLWVLYPPFMLGWYGTQSWAVWMLVALVVNIALLWGANRWVRTYEIAPVEWLWRSIIAGRPLPFGRRGAPSAGGTVPAAA